MPIYEYTCAACQRDFSKLQKVHEATPACPECGKSIPEDTQKRLAALVGSAPRRGKTHQVR